MDILDELKEICTSLDTKTLVKAKELFVDELANRTLDKEVGDFYDNVLGALGNKYTQYQINSLKPWRVLNKNEKQEVKKAYVEASGWLERKGFNKNDRVFGKCGFLITMVKNSPYFEGKLSRSVIVESLKHVDEIFGVLMHDYKDPAAFKFLTEVLNNGNSSTETPSPCAESLTLPR